MRARNGDDFAFSTCAYIYEAPTVSLDLGSSPGGTVEVLGQTLCTRKRRCVRGRFIIRGLQAFESRFEPASVLPA